MATLERLNASNTARNPKPDHRAPRLSGMQEGDRIYRQHLDPREPANLLDKALNQYAVALEQAPEAPEILVRMAKVHLRKGGYDKAERQAQKALNLLKIQPNHPAAGFVRYEAHYVLGFVHFQQEHHGQARHHYHQAILAGGLHSTRARLGYFQASQAGSKECDGVLQSLGWLLQGVYALLTSAMLLAFETERMESRHLLVVLPQMLLAWLSEETGNVSAGLDRYLELFRHYPGLAGVGIIIGDIYREKDQPEKARFWFERVVGKHPGNVDAHYHLAKLYERREEYANMAEVYEQLSRLRPGDPHVFCNLANAYYYNHAYKEALRNYELALHKGRDARWKAMVAQSIANIHADCLQNPDAAIAYYQMAMTLEPSEIENYLQLGLHYFQQDEYDQAELIYRKAVALAPENPRLYSNLGYLRWIEGDIEQAVQFYEQAIGLDDSYEIPLNNLGVIYLDTLGQVHKAIELFRQAILINDQYALAYYNLGRAHSFLDERLEAANCFQTAQELNRFSKELDNDELTARINNLFDPCQLESGD